MSSVIENSIEDLGPDNNCEHNIWINLTVLALK